jgi:hypothetical protein
MNIRTQFTTTLAAISDEVLRNQVRYHLVRRFYAKKHWVVRLDVDHAWSCKGIVRILKEHGDEPAL